MRPLDDNDLRELMSSYTVAAPPESLVLQTKRRMHQELNQLSVRTAPAGSGVVLLAGLAIVMSLCLFYMLTVGALLRMVITPSAALLLTHSIIAFTAAAGSLCTGGFMMYTLARFRPAVAVRY